jgi:hypothetical protein
MAEPDQTPVVDTPAEATATDAPAVEGEAPEAPTEPEGQSISGMVN